MIRAILVLALAASAHAASTAPVRVLSYESISGRGSLGEFLAREFPKFCAGCEVKFLTTDENAGLLGRLRVDARRGRKRAYDLVMGLDSLRYQRARAENLVGEGIAFEWSPFAVIVDRERLAKKDWPVSWKQLGQRWRDKLVVQDPRFSATGFGWLSAIFSSKLIALGEAKKTTAAVFPSWSSSYRAFLSGQGVAVWSYETSEAYHRCRDHTDRYAALPLAEGYPEQRDWIAPLGEASEPAKKFVTFVRSPAVQSQIPSLNWMLPALEGVKLPDCYAAMTRVKLAPAEPATPPTTDELQRWIDEWNL